MIGSTFCRLDQQLQTFQIDLPRGEGIKVEARDLGSTFTSIRLPSAGRLIRDRHRKSFEATVSCRRIVLLFSSSCERVGKGIKIRIACGQRGHQFGRTTKANGDHISALRNCGERMHGIAPCQPILSQANGDRSVGKTVAPVFSEYFKEAIRSMVKRTCSLPGVIVNSALF
jgi:hypothetical protein